MLSAMFLACATADPPPEPARSSDAPAPSKSGERCVGTDGLATMRLHSRGGHALAVTDLTLDFGSRRLSGTGFRLPDYGDPQSVPADRVVSEDELEALRAHLRTVCGTLLETDGPRSAAPGGSTLYEVVDAEGERYVLVYGQANVPSGTRYLELTREQFITLGQLFPEAGPPDQDRG